MAVCDVVESKKDILFGKFGRGMNDTREKMEAWKEVRDKAVELEACTDDRNWQWVRDKLWGAWKSKALVRTLLISL